MAKQEASPLEKDTEKLINDLNGLIAPYVDKHRDSCDNLQVVCLVRIYDGIPNYCVGGTLDQLNAADMCAEFVGVVAINPTCENYQSVKIADVLEAQNKARGN